MQRLGQAARRGAAALAECGEARKNDGLRAAARSIRDGAGEIIAANARDLDRARERGLSGALLDRLVLDDGRVEGIASGLEQVADLPDPVGRELARWTRPNGLDIARVAVPIGVIGVIYESRPNVTADAAALCV